jgi:hypothetical protein
MVVISPNVPGRVKRDAENAAGSGSIPLLPSGLVWSSLGHYRHNRYGLLLRNRPVGPPLQTRILTWLAENVSPQIPRRYYDLVLGHDLHVAVWAELYARHHHTYERDPFFPEIIGWTEDLGRVSRGKVTTAFRDFECTQLVAESALYGDFKYHEVGLGTTAEANTQTGLTTSTGITRVAGTQTNPSASTYQTIATITGDTNEVWAEHGIFNAVSGPTMLDRSLLSPTISMQAGDAVEFTYILTKSAEA